MRTVYKYFKNLIGDSKPIEVTEGVGSLGMARMVFNEDSDFKIRKTWVTTVNKNSFLVPKRIREDTTGRKHLTNDIKNGEMYNVGLLLTQPHKNEWVWGTWKRDNTARFKGYVTKKNHITIPRYLREKYNINDGDTIQVAITSRVFEKQTKYTNQSYVPELFK